MPEILKRPQLLEHDSKAKMYVRGSRVYPQLDPQRLAAGQATVELLTWDHIDRVLVDGTVPGIVVH